MDRPKGGNRHPHFGDDDKRRPCEVSIVRTSGMKRKRTRSPTGVGKDRGLNVSQLTVDTQLILLNFGHTWLGIA